MSCIDSRTAEAAAISILAATGSTYVSDSLGFRHCDLALSDIHSETGRTEHGREKCQGTQRRVERFTFQVQRQASKKGLEQPMKTTIFEQEEVELKESTKQ